MNLEAFRTAVKTKMAERGLDQTKLAKLLDGKPGFIHMGAAQKWLSKFLRGGKRPPIEPVLSICALLDIPVEILDLPKSLADTVPVIAFVSAGDGDVQFTDQGYPVGDGMETVPRPPGLDDPNAFGVEIHGDSMVPRYKHGDVVFVDTRIKPSNGDAAVVGFHSHERYVKLWHRRGGQISLESINPAYPPITTPFSNVQFAYKIKWVRER